jgi:hypothetical protein
MDELDCVRELKRQGFFCSQILMILGMDLQGKENPDLLRAVDALAGGIGFTGETCGGLTGGACLLGLYAGKGTPEEDHDPRLLFMCEELVRWFADGFGQQFGGIRCDEILNGGGKSMGTRCPAIVLGTFQKVKELLVENGFELTGEEL